MWSVQWEVVSVSSWGPPPRASLNQPGSSLVMTVGLLLRSRRGSQPDRASHPWGGGGDPPCSGRSSNSHGRALHGLPGPRRLHSFTRRGWLQPGSVITAFHTGDGCQCPKPKETE